MRAVIQRVKQASVEVGGQQVGAIGQGLLVLLAVSREDTDAEDVWMADKLPELRLFEDAEGKMNCSARTLGLPLLVASQFTLYGDAHRGRPPGFIEAAPPEEAEDRH